MSYASLIEPLKAQIERLKAEIERLLVAQYEPHLHVPMDGKMSDILERLENFSLYSYPPGEGIYHLGALQRAATAEIERLRADKDVLRSQQRNAAYERDIAALEAEIERLRAALNNLDACAVPTAEQIEQMEKGIGAIYTPAMALRLGMETAIGNVKRAMAALEQKSP